MGGGDVALVGAIDVKTCKACGDRFDGSKRAQKLERDGLSLQDGELAYCRTCADEKFRGIVKIQNVNTFPSGGGCPLEPNDDAGPWGENAIRELERDQ